MVRPDPDDATVTMDLSVHGKRPLIISGGTKDGTKMRGTVYLTFDGPNGALCTSMPGGNLYVAT